MACVTNHIDFYSANKHYLKDAFVVFIHLIKIIIFGYMRHVIQTCEILDIFYFNGKIESLACAFLLFNERCSRVISC